jgi:hypothetical protein
MNAIAGKCGNCRSRHSGRFHRYSVGVRHTMTAGLLHGALLLAVTWRRARCSERPAGQRPADWRARGHRRCPQLLWPRSRHGLAHLWHGDSRRVGDHVVALGDARGTLASGTRSSPLVGDCHSRRGCSSGGWPRVRLRQDHSGGEPTQARDRNYLVQFAAWTFAWAPGVLALTWRNKGVRASGDPGPHGAWR